MATVPVPRTWSVGDVVSAARLNTEIQTALNFVLAPPICSVYTNAGVTIPNGGTFQLMTWDTEVDDNDGMHSTISQTSRIQFNTPGRFELSTHIQLPVSTTTYTLFQIAVRLNAGGVTSGGTGLITAIYDSPGGAGRHQHLWMSRVFATGDYIEVFVAQTNSAAASRLTDPQGVYGTGLQAKWVATA